MGGQLHSSTQESQSAPWSAYPPQRGYKTFQVYRPLWKELPWHLEHPVLFAFISGTLLTTAIWLLTLI